jgi:hypothetical protein
VIFSDEVPLHVIMSRSRRYVRSRGSAATAYRPTIQAGGGSVMVWGGIFGEQVIPLYRVRGTLNSERYTELLSDALLPVINHSEVELTYQ